MQRSIIEQGEADITSHSGLAMVGLALNENTKLTGSVKHTRALVLGCSALAYKILQWIGQNGLIGPLSTVRRPAKRRRIRTVMQVLMYLAARIIRTGAPS